jgi:hypothetical protein
MNGLCRLSGVGPSITLDGKKFSVQGRTLRHYAEIEAQILSFRPDLRESVMLAVEGMEKSQAFDLACKLITEVKSHWCIADPKESHVWRTESWEGRFFSLWLAIRHHGLRQDESDAIASAEFSLSGDNEKKWKKIELAIDQATGDDALSRIDMFDGLYSVSGGSAMPWPLVLNELVNECGVDPRQAMDLTFNQAQVLLKNPEDLRYGGTGLDLEGAKSWQRQLRNKETDFVKELMNVGN